MLTVSAEVIFLMNLSSICKPSNFVETHVQHNDYQLRGLNNAHPVIYIIVPRTIYFVLTKFKCILFCLHHNFAKLASNWRLSSMIANYMNSSITSKEIRMTIIQEKRKIVND